MSVQQQQTFVGKQTTNTVLMVPPTQFKYNEETAQDNTYMKHRETKDTNSIVMKEYQNFVSALEKQGVKVLQLENNTPDTPDAIFVNNIVSTHNLENNTKMAIFYPMNSPSREKEKTPQLKKFLSEIGYKSQWELKPEVHSALEGTGSLVLDRKNRIMYFTRSHRTNLQLAQEWSKKTGFEIVDLGEAKNHEGNLVYHTNVVMSVGENYGLYCPDAISSEARDLLEKSLKKTNKEIIKISLSQMDKFCGNILELQGENSSVLVMSTTAFENFTNDQKSKFEMLKLKLVVVDIPTIENIGGGSARCCLGELF